MENAHLRLARLSYVNVTETRTTSISLVLDRFVAEPHPESAKEGLLHLMSVLGTDAEISAISAAIAKEARFRIETPGAESFAVRIAAKPTVFRGSISIEGRNRPSRHLLAVSQEWTNALSSSNPSRVFLLHSSPEFIWTNIAYIYGLPGRPEWATWFHQRLQEEQSIAQMFGVGCDPVVIQGDRDKFLSWLGEGVAAGRLQFPEQNGPIVWPAITLGEILVPAEIQVQVASSPQSA